MSSAPLITGKTSTGALLPVLIRSDGAIVTSSRGVINAAQSTVSVTRPNDTTAYAVGDVIGAATGSTAALEFTGLGEASSCIRILNASLRINVTSVPSGMTSFRLHLYNVAPPSAYGDNTAWDLPSGDRSAYVGYVDLGTPVDVGSTLYVQSSGLDYDFKMGSTTSLFGYLVTNGAFTPSAQTVKSISLIALPL